MFLTGAGVPALAHYCAVAHHDRSHQRVRRRSTALFQAFTGSPPFFCLGGSRAVRGTGSPHGFTAGAGISPAPESYQQVNYHMITVRVVKDVTYRPYALLAARRPCNFRISLTRMASESWHKTGLFVPWLISR